MKKSLTLLLIIVFVMAMSACSPKPNDNKEVAEPATFKEYNGVVIKKIPGVKLAVIRCEDTIANLAQNSSKLFRWLITSQSEIVGPNTAIFYRYPGNLDRDDNSTTLMYLIGIPVPKKTFGHGEVKIFDLDPYSAACILHRGPYTNIGSSYDRLLAWAMENNKSGDNFFREVYVSGPGPRDPVDPNKWITEIHMRLVK